MLRYSTAAAAPATPTLTRQAAQTEEEMSHLYSDKPTLGQRAALTAVPSGMYQAVKNQQAAERSRRAALKGKQHAGRKLVRDGQICSRMFDAYGNRPQPRNGINLQQSITMELEYVQQTVITSSGTAGVSTVAALNFTLSQFGAAAALAAVFDQYRFEQIETWVECNIPNNVASAVPNLCTAVDLDDSNLPGTFTQVSDKQGALTGNAPAGHYHKWRPHMAVATFSGAFTSYANVPATWIDSASNNVQHYGLKLAALSGGGAYPFNVTVRAVISFRAPAIN
jgi:hypothetical protein